PMPFLPLTVEYEERHYAIGKIPGSFMRREGRPGTQATLNARLVDRQIRPLFNKQLRNEIQVIATILSADQVNDPAPLAAIGASAALSISDVPWNGPVGCCTVGFVDGAYVANPSMQVLHECGSELELTVEASRDSGLRVEAAANALSEDVMVGAIEFAQAQIAPVVELIERMKAEVGHTKREFTPSSVLDEDLVTVVAADARHGGLRNALLTTGKHERGEAIKTVRDAIIASRVPDAAAEGAAAIIDSLKAAFDKAEQAELRRLVLDEGMRTDGRKPDQIRPIWI